MANDTIEMDISCYGKLGLEIPPLYFYDHRWHCDIYKLKSTANGRAVYVNTGRCFHHRDDLPRILEEIGITARAKELVA